MTNWRTILSWRVEPEPERRKIPRIVSIFYEDDMHAQLYGATDSEAIEQILTNNIEECMVEYTYGDGNYHQDTASDLQGQEMKLPNGDVITVA